MVIFFFNFGSVASNFQKLLFIHKLAFKNVPFSCFVAVISFLTYLKVHMIVLKLTFPFIVFFICGPFLFILVTSFPIRGCS
jgi:hypothetical protein